MGSRRSSAHRSRCAATVCPAPAAGTPIWGLRPPPAPGRRPIESVRPLVGARLLGVFQKVRMEQLPEFQVIEAGKALGRIQPHVPLVAGFNPLVILVAYPREFRHLLLGQIEVGAKFAQTGSQVFQGGHPFILTGPMEWEHPTGIRCLLYFLFSLRQTEACPHQPIPNLPRCRPARSTRLS